jgi:hypothetical protein
MRESSRFSWVEPIDELSAELGVSSAMLASLLVDAAKHAAAEHRAWLDHHREFTAEGVRVEERVALLG